MKTILTNWYKYKTENNKLFQFKVECIGKCGMMYTGREIGDLQKEDVEIAEKINKELTCPECKSKYKLRTLDYIEVDRDKFIEILKNGNECTVSENDI